MATLSELVKSGDLSRIEVELDDDANSFRRIYGTPEFIEWLDAVLPTLQTTVVGGDIDPIEQVDDIFHEYISGAQMNDDRRFKRLVSNPDDRHVWELKTLDLRIFGWIPKIDHFICAHGAMKDQIELLRAYPKFMAQTVYARTQLNLDEPKCLTSKDYHHVISA